MQCFDWNSNILNISTSTGIEFSLKLKGNKTIITGKAATGKTLLCKTIKEYKENSNNPAYNKYDLDNIFLLDIHNKEALKTVSNKLIIIDRADLILKHPDIKIIKDDFINKYLIIARTPLGIELSPNYYAEMIMTNKTVSLFYEFNVPGWN